MWLLSGLLIGIQVLAFANGASFVRELGPSDFDAVVLKSGKPSLVEFFAPWCGHCKALSPIYDELADSFASSSDKVIIAKVDADKHKDLGKRFGIQGFPTLKWFDGRSDSPEDYRGGRDLDSLSQWVAEKTGAKPKVKKAAPSAVKMLDDKSFVEEIGGKKDVIVAFTAPWCGHCKSLAPTWEQLAQDFATENTVTVAKVDAEAENSKATAKKQGVTSYPTIKYFAKGSKSAIAYEGARSEEALVTYLNAKAGTHRTIGGGLDAKAGTIEVLDAVVARLIPGQNVALISEEINKAAGALTDTYAEYYTRVATKLKASNDYAQKELTRLEGILKKGGLASPKKDDITSRTNILRKFVGNAEESVSSVKEEL